MRLLIAGSILSLYLAWPSIKDFILTNTPLELLRRMPPPKLTTVGLVNRANDCFANANIQALAGCPGLYLYLHQLQFICPDRQAHTLLLSRTLYRFIASLNEPVYAPKSISLEPIFAAIEQIYQKHISRAQHDAHEMLHLLLETMELEAQALAKTAKVPPFVFQGATEDRIVCLRCGFSSTTHPTPFLVLTLTLPQKRKTDLQTLLNEHEAGDRIMDYNCPKCSAPAAAPPAPISKSTRFTRLPESLAIHINRSIYSGGAQRNPCKLKVPEYLELRDARKTRRYRLCSLLRHSGTHSGGHYESARRKSIGFWRAQTHHAGGAGAPPAPAAAPAPGTPAASAAAPPAAPAPGIPAAPPAPPLPFPTPVTPKASVETLNTTPLFTTAPCTLPSYKGPKFWSISDTTVKENTFAQAVAKEAANYLVFYERVWDSW